MGNSSDNACLSHSESIIRTLPQIHVRRLFQLKLEDGTSWKDWGHATRQFLEVCLLGEGEAPISSSSPLTRPDALEICVRRPGRLTNALLEMRKGSHLHIRGPYGRGLPAEILKGQKVLLIAGGLGFAPLRALLLYFLDKRDEFDEVMSVPVAVVFISAELNSER